MAVKSLGFFLDRLKTGFRGQMCGFCQKNPIFNSTDLMCTQCEKRLMLRPPVAVTRIGGTPVFSACGFPFSMKRMLYDLKFTEQHQNGTLMADILTHYWQKLPESEHKDWWVVPIPPHHNAKSAHMPLIARPFASQFGYDFIEQAFTWSRPVEHQHKLHQRRVRQENVTGALELHPVLAGRMTSRSRILIIDDLLTTGATVGEAVAALKRAHPSVRVTALTVSQVPLALPRTEPFNRLDRVKNPS